MKIYNGDCIEIMKSIPDKSIDCVVCDFPYFRVVKNDFDNQWKNAEEYLEWIEKNIIEYSRILKDDANLFLFTSRQYNRHICMILDKYFEEKRIIIWCRKRGFNTSRGHALASGYEPICYYSRGNGVFNNIKIKPETTRAEYTSGILKDGICLSDVWNDIPALPHNAKEKTVHPTQKPIKLIERIIEIGTKPDDIILDNCMGSGTTGIACLNVGKRDFIGIELDKTYFNIAKERLENKVKDQNEFL